MQSSREVYADDVLSKRRYSGIWQPKASPLRTNLDAVNPRAKTNGYLPVTGKPFWDKKPAILLFPCE